MVRQPSGHCGCPLPPLLDGTQNLARLMLDFHASDIPTMSLVRAANARKRLLTLAVDTPNLHTAPGPFGELLRRLEERILMFR